MKMRAWLIFLGLSSVVIPTSFCRGADYLPFEMGLYAGAHTASDETNWHAAGLWTAQYDLNSYVSGDLQLGFMNDPSKMISIPQNFQATSIEFVPRLYIAPPPSQTQDKQWAPGICRPYIEGGVGYFFFSNPQVNSYQQFGVSDTIGSGFIRAQSNMDSSDLGFVFGGGLDYLVTPSITIGLDVAYVLLRPDIELKSDTFIQTGPQEAGFDTTSDGTTKLNLDSVRILLGIRYRFLR